MKRPDQDYVYPTIEDYEEIVGFKVNESFKIGWDMARTKSSLFNSGNSDPIKYIEIEESQCDLYNRKDEKLFIIKSLLQLNEVRLSIKNKKLSGYYLIFEDEDDQKIRIDIIDSGKLSSFPKGFFDKLECQLDALYK